jgi:hypothetical protein
MDLQRNLNQYYIKKDREYDLTKWNLYENKLVNLLS